MTDRVRSLERLFYPRSVAVIGASADPAKFGGRPVHYMKEGGFQGRLYPVNPNADEIQGLEAYAAVGDIEGPVDYALIAVPAALAPAACEACADKGVGAAVVFAAGFSEVGADGRRAQERLAALAARTGMRILGPNCMGTLSAGARLAGTFTSALYHGWPGPGAVAIASQSGAFGSHLLVLARERGLGVSHFVSTGNECDVDLADCIAYLAGDPATRVIIGYMESCRDGERLVAALEDARRAGKPVALLKVGRSEVGAQAAATHTAADAGCDAVYDGVFRQHGVYRAESVDELMDIGQACAAGMFPTGNRLGIVTISGGAGVLMADRAAETGLDVPEMPESAQRTLKTLLPHGAVRNPVDTTAQALTRLELIERCLEVMLDEGGCDAVSLFLTSVGLAEPIMTELREILPEVRKKYPDDPIVLSMMTREEDRRRLEALGFIVLADPTRAVEVIAALVAFGRSFRAARSAPPVLPEPAAIPTAPTERDALRLLAEAGLPVAEGRFPDKAATAAGGAIETVARVRRDPVFGPMVMFGLGAAGTSSEAVLRRAPFGVEEARAMIDEIRDRAMLDGGRGRPAADVAALASALARLAGFAAANAGTVESVDIDPLAVLPSGQGVVAVKARLARTRP